MISPLPLHERHELLHVVMIGNNANFDIANDIETLA